VYLRRLSYAHSSTAQVAAHNTAKSCYIRLLDYVFDVTAFLTRHPGGEKILLQQAGDKDRSNIFAGVHSNKAAKMLPDLLVGTISGAGSRWTASPVHPRAPAPVPEPSGSLKALARQDSQGSVFSESARHARAFSASQQGRLASQQGMLERTRNTKLSYTATFRNK
jgi:4-hydroxysphinganine ceramide fatty acyl 2-hydroxylase